MVFRVGQKVVCVDALTPYPSPGPGFSGDGPINGNVYTVRRSFFDDEGEEVLWLDEIERCKAARACWGPDVGYGAFRFRPIVETKTDISIFQKMLTPKKEKSNVV